MEIVSFSSDSSEVPKHKKLEEKITERETSISHAEVVEYANYIIGKLKELTLYSDQDKVSFVVDALNESRLIKNINHEIVRGNLDKEEARSTIKRIQQALVGELKGKIDEKIYFIIKDIVNKTQGTAVTFVEKPLPSVDKEEGDKEETVSTVSEAPLPKVEVNKYVPTPVLLHKINVISEAIDVNSGKKVIYKNQKRNLSIKHEQALKEAAKLFDSLPQHPNIVKILENDPKNDKAIHEYRTIKNLHEYIKNNNIDFYRNPKEFADILETINGCMEGAAHIAEDDLVLQDIKLSNLGKDVEEGEVKGVLFDMEGLVKEGALIVGRMYTDGYKPPEDIEDGKTETPITRHEMTYQFGICLKKVLSKCVGEFSLISEDLNLSEMLFKQRIIKDLRELAEDMSKINPNNRVSLEFAVAELASIIESIRNH